MKLTNDSSIGVTNRAMAATDSISDMLRMLIIATMTLDEGDIEIGVERIHQQTKPTMLSVAAEFESLNDFLVNNVMTALKILEGLLGEMMTTTQDALADGQTMDDINPEDFA